MANMGYCRFENTVGDLKDCYDNMDDSDLSATETKARERLLLMCKRIADDYESEIEDLMEARKKRIAEKSKVELMEAS